MAAAKSSPYQQGYQKGWLDAWRGVVNLTTVSPDYTTYGAAYRQAISDFNNENHPQRKN